MKLLISLCLILCLVVPMSSQEASTILSFHTKIETRGLLDLSPEGVSAMLTNGEKDRFILTEAGTFDDNGDYMGGFIKKGSTIYVYFQVLCAALLAQKVRIHTVVCGPAYASTFSNWYQFQKNELGTCISWAAVSELPKGCYTITVFVESNRVQSGSAAMSTFKAYVY